MKVYVGNLPWSVTDSDLLNLFEPFGSVDSAQVVTDRDSGRSRGFGFVEMDDESAASAIEALGMSLPFSASRPAESDHKADECRRAGRDDLLRPKDL